MGVYQSDFVYPLDSVACLDYGKIYLRKEYVFKGKSHCWLGMLVLLPKNRGPHLFSFELVFDDSDINWASPKNLLEKPFALPYAYFQIETGKYH